ncbi:unnamed protein product, partial [marine sediment metagenome]
YADWYWKHSVDADALRDEQYETVLAPILADVIDNIAHKEELPEYMQNLLQTMVHPEHAETGKSLLSIAAEVTTKIVDTVTMGGFKKMHQAANRDALSERMQIESGNILKMRRKCTEDYWNDVCAVNNYPPDESRLLYESQKPYPSIPDLITASRYLGDPYNPRFYAQELFDITDKDYMIWDWLSYQKLTTQQVQELFKRGVYDTDDTNRELARLGWHELDGFMVKSLAHSLPNPMIMAQGLLLQNANLESILTGISAADIKPDYAQTYLDAVM